MLLGGASLAEADRIREEADVARRAKGELHPEVDYNLVVIDYEDVHCLGGLRLEVW